MRERQPEPTLADRIQETVDRTATSIEEIHKSIVEIPLDVIRRSGFFEKTADDVSDLQARSIGAVYDVVRDINHRVTDLASDLLQPRDADPEAPPEASQSSPR